MKIKLSGDHQKLHELALNLSQRHRKLEGEIIETLLKVEATDLHRRLGYSSLFLYVTGALRFTDATAYSFILVMRKSRELPELKKAILSSELSVSKAQRMVSSLTAKNVSHWLEFSKKHSCREIDREAARQNPKKQKRDRATYLDGNLVELKISLREEIYQKLKHAQDLESQRKNSACSFEETLEAVLKVYTERNDPVVKAKRVLAKKTKEVKNLAKREDVDVELCTYKVEPKNAGNLPEKPSFELDRSQHGERGSYLNQNPRRRPLTAAEKHTVFARDGGRCTHINAEGVRCSNERWLHIHHLHPVSLGGSNDPSNLTTLCSSCHDLCHQYTLPLEGQYSQLRSPQRVYELKVG